MSGAEGRAFGQPLAEGRRRLALGRSGGQRRLGRHDQAVAILHQRVAEIGETAFLSLGFPEQTRILVRRRGVRRVRPLRLAEIRLSIAAGRRRARTIFGLKTLHRRPRL